MLGRASTERHLPADVVDVPSGERGQAARLPFVAIAKTCAIGVGGSACHRTGEGMSKDVAPLKVLAVARFLEHEILREVLAVVANVKPCDEGVRRPGFAAASPAQLVEPEHAELSQLVAGQGVRGAGIAPGHVPRVLEKHAPHVLFANLLVEHGLVELAELSFDVDGSSIPVGSLTVR